jgi:hypothetical protein
MTTFKGECQVANHSHGTYGFHNHPVFDSTGDHIAAHDGDNLAKLEKFFAGATWLDGLGMRWPDTIFTTWADSSEAQADVKFEQRKA